VVRREQIIERLVSLGLLRTRSLRDLSEEASKNGRTLIEEAIISGALSPDATQFLLSEAFDFPFMELEEGDVSSEAAERIPPEVAWREEIIPLSISETHITVGMVDPMRPSLLRYLESITGKKVRVSLVTRETLRSLLKSLYPPPIPISFEKMSGPLLEDVNIVRYLSCGDSEGLAEEILIECKKLGFELIYGRYIFGRFSLQGRVEDESRELLQTSRDFGRFFFSGLEKMLGIEGESSGIFEKIVEIGPEQRGGMFRISIVKGFGYPSVTVRVIPNALGRLSLDSVGLDEEQFDALSRILGREKGIYIVASPDYAGVTTTLYSMARYVQKPHMSIVAIEEQIRYKNEGFVQIEKGDDPGEYSIEKIVKTMSPDVLIIDRVDLKDMLSEYSVMVHPHVSVFAGIKASALDDVLGVFLQEVVSNPDVATALKAILFQKLVRVLCPTCKREVPGYPSGLVEGRGVPAPVESLLRNLKYYIPSGCESCGGTGYAGVRALFDLLVFTPSARLEMLSAKPLPRKREEILAKCRYTPEETIFQMLMEGMVTIEDALPFLKMYVMVKRGDL